MIPRAQNTRSSLPSGSSSLPAIAVERAQRLSAMVHGDGGPEDVARLLTPLSAVELYGLAVALAAMVDVDKTVTELLAWSVESSPRIVEGFRQPPLMQVAS